MAAKSSRRLVCFHVFVEPDAIAERVDDLHAFCVVKRRLDPRAQVLVAPARDLPVELLDAGHPHEDR
jgi:hypothetical protein